MKPTLPPPRPVIHVIAAILAIGVALGLLGSVAMLFQRDGVPLEPSVVTARAGVDHVVGERHDACAGEWHVATGSL
jgi:hypothetical protein